MRDLRAPLSGALCIPSSFVLYRFSEPVVRVERKNVLKTTKILRGYIFPARSRLHRLKNRFTVGTKRLLQYLIRFFSFPGQFMLASVLNFSAYQFGIVKICSTFNLE